MFRSSRRVQGTWYEYTIDLSSYAGAEGYVAIRHFNCTDMFRLNVDDITLETSELLDSYDPAVEVMPEKVTLPDGATVTPYYTVDGKLDVYTSSGWTDYTKKVKNINVAFVGTDVYIQGLSFFQQESWVKGTLADNVITVPSGQYVGDVSLFNSNHNSITKNKLSPIFREGKFKGKGDEVPNGINLDEIFDKLQTSNPLTHYSELDWAELLRSDLTDHNDVIPPHTGTFLSIGGTNNTFTDNEVPALMKELGIKVYT